MDKITNYNKNNTEHTTIHEHMNNYQGKTKISISNAQAHITT
jgi:hypothetical protein